MNLKNILPWIVLILLILAGIATMIFLKPSPNALPRELAPVTGTQSSSWTGFRTSPKMTEPLQTSPFEQEASHARQ